MEYLTLPSIFLVYKWLVGYSTVYYTFLSKALYNQYIACIKEYTPPGMEPYELHLDCAQGMAQL